MTCPTCKKPVAEGDSFYPFCSRRCRVIDLGQWAAEKYVISTPLAPEPQPAEPDAE